MPLSSQGHSRHEKATERQEVNQNVSVYLSTSCLASSQTLPQQLLPLPKVSCVLHTPPEVALWTTPTVVKKVKPKAPWFQFPF